MDAEGVQGVLIEEDLLFHTDGTKGGLQLWPDAVRLLCRLRYSKLLLGILGRENLDEPASAKEILLRDIGLAEVQLLQNSLPTEASITAGWAVPSSASVYITGQHNEPVERELISQGWKILRVGEGAKLGVESGDLVDSILAVEYLHEIPAGLSVLNKKVWRDALVVVGYTMKWSRELDLLKRGALPIVRNSYGLSFLPILLDKPLGSQLFAVDVVLHKATDEILSVRSGNFVLSSIEFSDGIQELQRYLQEHPEICVVDPIERVLPLLDRVETQAILKQLRIPGQQIIRSPHSVEVTSFEEPMLSQALASANEILPAIVKPRIACGASEAHSMAIIFSESGFRGLRVPLPAVIQEYVDHGAHQYKMYAVGSKLLCSRRKSTPNASKLVARMDGAPALLFDSLKSLPVEADSEIPEEKLQTLDFEVVQKAADWLRSKLGLTIIGFDIVVQSGSNDYIIVDVNYFPTFKDVPNEEALPAFWQALVTAHSQWTT
ncbi:hypothetical protein R1sor_017851 [Riccia sorocarpa]|uniref:Inositol-1,3,4-trisphosphate 5/6-kinase n=1 Tax=Riccia sorocarpa TaxID=122646 RepID=A0ABD3IE99_9MARC